MEPLRETNCYLEYGLERQLMSSSSEEAGKLSLELAGIAQHNSSRRNLWQNSSSF